MGSHSNNSAAQWFKASEALGDDMGILYGRIPHGSREPEWHHVSHIECDGIGGFARLLRRQGATIAPLPTTKAPCRAIFGPLWHLWNNRHRPDHCATRRNWTPDGARIDDKPKPVAWHVFTRTETGEIIDRCREQQITVNTLLLKCLDASVRPELGIPKATIPWMIPVNLRGDLTYPNDTDNHVSCVDVFVSPEEPISSLHQRILRQLNHGEHRANSLLLKLGSLLPHPLKVKYLAHDRTKPTGTIGAFSNLGSWNIETPDDHKEAWLFCPPVVLGQRLSAGCVTFQNQLSLTLRIQPYASDPSQLARQWMDRWINAVRIPACNAANRPYGENTTNHP